MEQIVELLTFTESLLPAEQLAQQFSQEQLHPTKAHQVRLNTFAVYAAHYYLTCIGVQTDLATSGSWDALTRMVWDAADLVLPNLGKLECRSLLPGDTTVTIPLEVWDDRIGCLVVKIDEDQHQSEILGFVRKATVEAVPLDQLESLESFIDYLCELEEAVVGPITHLQQWLQGQIDSVWKTVEELREELFGPPPQPAQGWRSHGSQANDPDDVNWVKRAKILDLPPTTTHEPLAIVVGLQPIDGVSAQATDDTMNIWVKICPLDSQAYLPPDLNVALLNDQGTEVTHFRTFPEKNAPRLRFRGKQGDRFSVRVELAQTSLTETFLI